MNTKRSLLSLPVIIFLCMGFLGCGPVGGFSTGLDRRSSSVDEGSKSSTPPTPPLVATPAPTPVANAKYVSTSGNNTNDGSSQSPWKTISYGLSKLNSGDTLYVMTGTYAEAVSINQNGITLSAYPNNKPVIDGGTTLPSGDWGSLILVAGNNNTISGFEVKNSNVNNVYRGGYGVQVLGHHNTISKVNAHHASGQGIIVNGDYNIVEDSRIWQAARSNAANPGSTGWGSGMSAARNHNPAALKPGITSYATFRRNVIYNNWGEGVSFYESDHCTMEDNITYDNWTVNLYISDTTNALVQRNIIYVSSAPDIPTRNNSHPALTLADEVSNGTTIPHSANNTIINNFIYNTNLQAFSWSLVPDTGLRNVLIANNTIVDGNLSTGAGGNIVNSNSQIRNNIITGRGSNVPSNSGITFSNNNWAVTPSQAVSSTDVAGDPQIARAGTTEPGTLTSAYFKILGSSPVIGKGVILPEVPIDFFGTSRNGRNDIGGHQF